VEIRAGSIQFESFVTTVSAGSFMVSSVKNHIPILRAEKACFENLKLAI
jgi:hypothetical protein